MNLSLPDRPTDDAPYDDAPYAMWDLTAPEMCLLESTRKLVAHRQALLVGEAQGRRDEQSSRRPAHTSPLPPNPRKGPFFCATDLTIAEVSLVNCLRHDRAPLEIWAELARLQCEEIAEGSAAV